SGSSEAEDDRADVLRRVDALRERMSFLDIVGPGRLRKAAATTLAAPFAIDRGQVAALLRAVGEQYDMDWNLDAVEAEMLGPDTGVLGRGVFDWFGDLLPPWI